MSSTNGGSAKAEPPTWSGVLASGLETRVSWRAEVPAGASTGSATKTTDGASDKCPSGGVVVISVRLGCQHDEWPASSSTVDAARGSNTLLGPPTSPGQVPASLGRNLASPLTSMSENPTIDVMNDDASAAPAPPPPAPGPVPDLDGNRLRRCTEAELAAELNGLVSGALPAVGLNELAGDGSARIASLVAVWLIAQVGKAVGQPKLVSLSNVKAEDLRSVAGVARLTYNALRASSAQQAAAS